MGTRELPPISDTEANLLINLIKKETGVHLDKSKTYLIQSRLASLIESTGIKSFYNLYTYAASGKHPSIVKQIVSSITTHETFFFRESAVYDSLMITIISDIVSTGSNSLRIWSAACSTGQEAYSIAMVCKEKFDQNTNIEIVGTDICHRSIDFARKGVYSSFEINRGMSPQRARRFFRPCEGGMRVCEELQNMVSFKTGNILNSALHGGIYDLVLCRNVAMYFSREDRTILYENIASRLKSGGKLVLGITESLDGLSDKFNKTNLRCCVYYVKKER